MRFLFIVQGEGRGHMTQAIALRQILTRHGHQICAVMVGQSRSRVIPKFFIDRMDAPVFAFSSPNFRLDSKRRGVSILGTAMENLKRLPRFARSLGVIHKTLRSHNPDMIINFYDPLAAIYAVLCRPKQKMMCIGHQYLMLHPDFVFPRGRKLAVRAMLLYTRLSALGASLLLALSFRKMEDHPRRRIAVMPPLLRSELKDKTPTHEDFLVVYVLNDGYAEDLAARHREYPHIRIVGFWDRKGAREITHFHENLTFHPLDDVAFLDAMRRCRGLVSTAGFESVCEAMYLGKPVYMTPTEKQIEQHCNAIDACLAGPGIWGFDFDLGRFLDYIPRHQTDRDGFREWADSAETRFISLICGMKFE